MGAKKHKKGKAKKTVSGNETTQSRAYEGAQATAQRRHVLGMNQSPDAAMEEALPQLREWGGYLDENYDLATGILDELVCRIVGSGIVSIPKPLLADGSIDERFGVQIMDLWRPWTRAADVTGELSWHDAQRLCCRAWMRDGEEFVQHVAGRERGYPFARDSVPYRVELIEAAMVPYEMTGTGGWRQGIRFDEWRRPLEYAVYKRHPGSDLMPGTASVAFAGVQSPSDTDAIKRVRAETITHLKSVKRWPQTRGTTVFHSVIGRLYDSKDIQESERIKNRILASWTAAINRAPDMEGYESTDSAGNRYLRMAGGTIIDTLAPGESITGVGPDYPNAGVNDYLADNTRYIASGTGTRYSSIAKRYDGTYSAQRQEMVESEGHYKIREDAFVSKLVRRVYENWMIAAVLDGMLRIPSGMTIQRAMNAEYRGPITPWVDPLKEVQADKLAVESAFITQEQVQIKRGMSPSEIGKPAQTARTAPLALVPRDEDEDDEDESEEEAA